MLLGPALEALCPPANTYSIPIALNQKRRAGEHVSKPDSVS